MTDTELDEILDSWIAPPAPASLREGVRAGFGAAMDLKPLPVTETGWRAALARRALKGLLAVAVVVLAAFVLVFIQAVAQTLRSASPTPQVPYVVDSEFVQYTSDGAPEVTMHTTSYSQDGKEILLSRTLPGNPIGTAIARTLAAVVPLIAPRPHLTPEMEERIRAARANPNRISLIFDCDRPTCWITKNYGFQDIGGVATGCAQSGATGRETILGYSTVAAQRPLGDSKRMTLWMAPDLGCFALRATMEERGPGGAFRLVSRKQAIKVTLNP